MASLAHVRECLKRDLFRRLQTMKDLLSAEDIVVAAAEAQYRWRDRIWNPVTTVWAFLVQVLHPGTACREAVATVLAEQAAEHGGREPKSQHGSRISVDPSAYCQARQRIPVAVFKAAFNKVGCRLQGKVQDSYRCFGRRLWIVDGSTVSTPDTGPLQEAFPQSCNQTSGCGFPMVRIVALFAWASGVVQDVAISQMRKSELSLLYRLWGLLEPGDILLGDRFFCTYRTLAQLAQRACDGIFRLNGWRAHHLDWRKGRRISGYERLVTWQRTRLEGLQISRRQWEQLPEKTTVRLIRYHTEVPGYRSKTILLATTLLDPIAYPMQDLVGLYGDRWTVELRLDELKTTMKMEPLRCKSPDTVRKEILMHLLVYNLIRALLWQASQAHDRPLHRLSFAGAVQRLDAMAPYLQLFAGTPRAARLYTLLLDWIASDLLPYRPGRVEPRAVKRRPKPYPRLHRPRREVRAALLRNAA